MDRRQQFATIDEYIAAFPPDVQAKLQELRAAIRAAAPDAEERISYQMPAYYLKGNLVYFAAFTHHIGFYPTSSGIAAFQKEIEGYASSKGAVQFPINKPLPLELVDKIVRYRVAENLKNAAKKGKKE
ncbi:uncharacterized conserved protein [Longilinea arvoryzae]|uniref:Uncharacterized conserved protein n=1 Tax=Longilinea arvoryzae TaxID=360412 RepID=A0A0S7BD48_9CHLR|nr:DUF1801 domain-containing protein [Longilinea arvoryzae]GAP12644.1 uncharacterized conserved protein [Longilinea arvoryzae]